MSLSIKKSACLLCKELWKLEDRDKIAELVNSLYERSGFSLLQSFSHIQFLGPLHVYRYRNRYGEFFKKKGIQFESPSLSEEEILLLEEAHSILQFISRRCLSGIMNKYPSLENVFDLNSKFEYSNHLDIDVQQIFDENILDEIINSFCSNIYVETILNVPEHTVFSNIDLLKATVIDWLNKLNQDIDDIPSWMGSPPQVDEDANLLKLISSVVCLSQIINNLNQLLFQSFFLDKLPLFDINNIIDIDKNSSCHICHDIVLVTRDDFLFEMMRFGYPIVLFKNPINSEDATVLMGRILSHSFEWGDYGQTQKLFFRELDDMLCSYSNLLH